MSEASGRRTSRIARPKNGRDSDRSVFSVSKFFRRVTNNPVETDLGEYREIVEKINEGGGANFTDAEILERAGRLRVQLENIDRPGPNSGESVGRPRAEIEVFGLVREAARRALGLDPFDVQMIAGLAMARGRIAELPTGEGKTLAAVFPAALSALSGRGVHVLTFNDYLARRDAEWMGPAYRRLGLSVGCVQEAMTPDAKRAAYRADVTYATAKEAGFDFLRDRLAYDAETLVHRPFHAAFVDEADSILIDEARIPLVISGAADRASWDARRLAALVRDLAAGRDFETDAEHRNVFLTDAGTKRSEAILGVADLFAGGNQRLLEALYCSLHAEALLRRDVDYIVRDGRIEIVDEFTGRVVDKRHWPDGLQAAVEAKEGLARRTEGRVLGSITLQHFFRSYPNLAGMTATARSAAREFQEFYGLNVAVVPAHTPSLRADLPDAVFAGRAAKRRALVEEIRRARDAGRPVLVGTASVKESEELAADLSAAGVEGRVLNAKNDELEAGIIADAGRPGAVTISTNMAGRGTDIRLGGANGRERERAVALGGLYVIGTNRHESLRIDRQLRGRSGRQGDPGSTRFFISLEDDLFERYGLTRVLTRGLGSIPAEAPVSGGALQSRIEHAQRVIEGQTFDIRRSLRKFSSLVEIQRRIVQERRDEILLFGAGEGEAEDAPEGSAKGAEDLSRDEGVSPGSDRGGPDYADSGDDGRNGFFPGGLFAAREPRLYRDGVRLFGRRRLAELERRAALYHLDRGWSDHLAWVQDTRESIHLVSLGGKTPLHEFQKAATDEFFGLRRRVADAFIENMAALVRNPDGAAAGLEKLKGPSSTWTYLVNEDQFGWGIEMIKGRNIGFAAVAAGGLGPLFVLTLIANRLKRKKRARPPAE